MTIYLDGVWEEYSVPNETEKLTINLSVVDLAQVDVLVEQGLFSNRSDFIRTATRKQLELYKDKIELSLTPLSTKKDVVKAVGIISITKKELERLADEKGKLSISVIGMLSIDSGISEELFLNTVESVIIRGKLIASKGIKKIIEEMS